MLGNCKRLLVKAVAVAVVAFLSVSSSFASDQWKLGVGLLPQPNTGGILITQVFDGSPAQQLGLAAGDVIISVNGAIVNDPLAVRQTVFSSDSVVLIFQDGNGFHEVTATFEKKPTPIVTAPAPGTRNVLKPNVGPPPAVPGFKPGQNLPPEVLASSAPPATLVIKNVQKRTVADPRR